ncbi:MAG: nucleotidyltransferase domain-containing protein [Nanoarchaeota archaeon]|nr:nucleotidyltransferase domain-containing protein [Nanoarchaeota archaeon]
MRKLKQILKKHLTNNIADIFIIGSFLKNKLSSNDLDIIILFKEKNLSEVEATFYKINEELNIKNLHLEPIFAESMFTEKIFLTIMHEGFSIKNNEKVSNLLNLKPFSLFTFNLKNLTKIEKVKFAQALYGRRGNGLLFAEKGTSLGHGSFKIPIENEEIFKEFFIKWKIKYARKRIFVNN